MPRSDLDVFMRAFDKDFNVLNWDWGIVNPTMNDEGYGMAFSPDGTVYMMGWMDISIAGSNYYDNLYVAQTDALLNKQHEIYFRNPRCHVIPYDIDACPDGGCIVYATRINTITEYKDHCIYKITPEDFLNVEEAHAHGFSVVTPYPNPGDNTLNIRTTLQNAHLEIYDLNGKLVCYQEIADIITSINTESWPSGTYVWRVATDGKEVETGKWIKK